MQSEIYNLKQDDARRIAVEFTECENYNQQLGFYEQCRRNNAFYHGDQWRGLKKNGKIQLMTQNFLQRPVSYFVSQIVSDDIGYQLDPLIEGSVRDNVMDVLPDLIDRVCSRNDMQSKNRDVIKAAAIEGEGVTHWYFDTECESGDIARGDIRAEIIPTCNVLYGNPHSCDTQAQPFILIKRRVPVQQMQERARQLGYSDWSSIAADTNSQTESGTETSGEKDRVTEIIKYWKVRSTQEIQITRGAAEKVMQTVHFCRYCGGKVIQKDTDTGLNLYPIARMLWNQKTGSYHCSCPITAFIPAQITLNRSLTLVCEFVKNHGLPKIFYDRGKLPRGLSNNPAAAYGVAGDPNLAAMQILPAAEIPTSILNLDQQIVDQSRDFMGTSDAALGNIRPDNTSAIIATQKATAAPLLLQTQNFYQYVREYVRIVIDMIGSYYGERVVRYEDKGEGISEPILMDFDTVSVDEMELEIEVGAASYWSELTTIQTLDNLLSSGILSIEDPESILIYLNNMPTGYLPGKADIVKYYENRLEDQQLQQQAAAVADQIQSEQAIQDADAAQAQQEEAAPEQSGEQEEPQPTDQPMQMTQPMQGDDTAVHDNAQAIMAAMQASRQGG